VVSLGADAGSGADLFNVVLCRAFPLHAAFLINFAYALTAAGNDFDHLGAQP